MKKCQLCERWNKPTKKSGCNIPEHYDPIFILNLAPMIRNEDGTYYCSEFKSKTKPR